MLEGNASYLSEFNLRASLLAARYASALPGLLGLAQDHAVKHADSYFSQSRMDSASKPFPYKGGLAFIPVTGVLLNRFPWCTSYACGYGAIRDMVSAAVQDSDVQGIVFDVNSYGGMAQGCFELSNFIYESRKQKPSLAIVDANACSAAYAVASAATKVSVIQSADVGSIGVLVMHVSVAEALADEGIEVTYVFAGKHKVDGNPYEKLSAEARKELQEGVDATYDQFVACVARNRNLDPSDVKATEARVFGAEEAVELGLVDKIDTPISAISAFSEDPSSIYIDGDKDMTTTATQPGATAAAPAAAAAPAPAVDTAQIAADARKAERERSKAIMGSPDAKDKQKLASHLAYETELSVEASTALLKAAAPETQAAAPAPQTNAGNNPFARAMDTSPNPNISSGDEGAGKPATAAEKTTQILSSFQKASGAKIPALQKSN